MSVWSNMIYAYFLFKRLKNLLATIKMIRHQMNKAKLMIYCIKNI